jgi:hypothetical protein
MTALIGRLLCKLGFHKWRIPARYLPARCERCGDRQ